MSAEKLREAAKVLRERAETATAGPWAFYEMHGRDFTDEGWSIIGVRAEAGEVAMTYPVSKERDEHEADAIYIATMHPGVGLALADWLDASADFHEDKPHGYDCLGCQAEEVADAILGGAS
jgi:hypothetical protein